MHPASRLQFSVYTDLKVELFPVHSPLLRESLLVSFPPLSYMLKFSGSSYLISGQSFIVWVARWARLEGRARAGGLAKSAPSIRAYGREQARGMNIRGGV